MPTDPAVTAAAISGSASLLSGGLNYAAQSSINRKTRNYNNEMYDKQRSAALQDFQMQNEYNSPTAQMKRLREAGLNPNLIYGNGANSPSATVRSSDTPAWHPDSPRVDIGAGANSAISAYYDTKIKNATVDNLTAQNTVLLKDALLKDSQIANMGADTAQKFASTATTQFQLGQAQRMKDISAQAQEQSLRKLTAETDKVQADTAYTLDQNERAALQNATSLREAAERILTMRMQRTKIPSEIAMLQQQLKNLETDNELKQKDLELKKNGVQPHDSLFMRSGANILNRILNSDHHKKVIERLKNFDTYRKYMTPF